VTQSSDHHQSVAALGHMAFIPAAEQAVTTALSYLRGAQDHLDKRPHGPLSSWLAAVESEIHRNAGSYAAALTAIDRARESLATPGLSADLPWFDYYDETRLAGFAGYAMLRAGQYGEARQALTEALGCLPRTAVKQRAVFLTDLASVQLHDRDLDEACRTAGDAADELRRAGYATGFDRLREFRSSVNPWRASQPVRMLDDQLATVA
jgi:tetratricopeptide (TPR) repeat protein